MEIHYFTKHIAVIGGLRLASRPIYILAASHMIILHAFYKQKGTRNAKKFTFF